MNQKEARDFLKKSQNERIQVRGEKIRAQMRSARKLQTTHSRSKQRKADNEAIADYLARTPPPRYV